MRVFVASITAAMVLTQSQASGATTFQPTESYARPCNYSDDDARRIDFLAAFQAATQAALQLCGDEKSVTADKLRIELEGIVVRAQRRNPDVNLTTLEARSGTEVCHVNGDTFGACEGDRPAKLAAFVEAMSVLRDQVKKWR